MGSTALAAARQALLDRLGLDEVETVCAPIHCNVDTLPEVTGAMRPRACLRHGHAAVYMPRAHTEALETVRARWRTARGDGRAGWDGPVVVALVAHRAMPASWPKRRMGDPDTSVPDVDNMAKLVMDALTGVAWKDDAQVVALVAAKAPRSGDRDWYEVEVTYARRRQLV
jgi:Holliday junction resolvase RusA-like endonuclease